MGKRNLRNLFSAAALAAAGALMACGGGGSASGDASGSAATSFASGPISGFGSVIVNGVRFDDTNARVSDDDGQAHDRGELRLGMVVEVKAGALSSDDRGSHAQADDIAFHSELVGPIDAIDVAAKTLTVIGQPVDIAASTVFDDRLAAGLASLHVGDVVEVYGTFDAASGRYAATRIEPKPDATRFMLRGVVAGLDTTARTFTIGGQTISYAGLDAAQVPGNLANGLLVRVRVGTAQVAGAWVAEQVRDRTRRMDDRDEAELKGRIDAYTSSAQFSVDGIPVDASAATFPDGTAGIVLGARVEVQGRSANGVVLATRVTIENEDRADHGDFELHGAVGALDTAAKTFALRGLTVDYGASSVEFKDGSAALLANGVQVEVKGGLSADGTRVVATRVEFEH